MITAWIRMNEITEAQVKLGPYLGHSFDSLFS